MKVAVTGGSGQLGTLVLRRLAMERSVSEVVSLDLRPPMAVGDKLRAHTADVRDPHIGRFFEGCDALVHLAFVVTGAPPRNVFDDINVEGSRNVFRAAAVAGVERIVYSSSVAAYGVVHGHPQPLVESSPRVHQPDFPYASAKFQVEAFLDEFEREFPGISVARLRPAILVGRVMDHPLGATLRRRALLDLGDAPVPIVWDEDVADAVVLALKKGARGAFNLSADELLSASGLARAGGLRLRRVPRPVLVGAVRTAKALADVGLGSAVDPAWIEKGGVPMVMSSARAKEELGWKPKRPTAAQVITHFVETVPGGADGRVEVFLRLAAGATRVAPSSPDVARLNTRIHLALSGPTGGDYDLRFNRGRLSVRSGVPRPPSSAIFLSTSTLLDLLAGRLDYSTAQLTGKVRVDGEPLAGMVLLGMVTAFRTQAVKTGLLAWPARRMSEWFGGGAAP